MKRILNKLIREEKGQALVAVLILMLVGGLIIAPLLSHMSTGLWVGKEVFEERMYGQYAADSGVEDALYKIKVGDLPEGWEGTWDESDYEGEPYEYSLPQLNGNSVDVTISTYWILADLEEPFPGMAPHSDMVVVGDATGTDPDTGNGLYQISISYLGTGTLKIERIGAWLPSGFEYVPLTSNLEYETGKAYCEPEVFPFRGGTAIRWDFDEPRPNFTDLPSSGGKGIVTFQFTPAGNPVSAFSWVVSQPNSIWISWDADIKVYQITSEATDVVSDKTVAVEAYAAKNEARKMGSTISGDYVAVGNTLMTPNPNDSQSDQQNFRARLYKESSTSIQSSSEANPGYIPPGATVESAYLYWSGWISHYYWYKSGSNWTWSKDNDNGTGLVYPNNPTSPQLTDLVERAAKVNTVNFGGGGVMQDITTHDWQVWPKINDSPACWYYTCLYDATSLVKQPVENAIKSGSGTYTFTLGHASTVVSPPTSNLRPGYTGSPPKYETYQFNLCDKNGNPTSNYTGYPLGTPATRLPGATGTYPVIGASQSGSSLYNASYAGWSLIIIYSSPETKGHQLYLYDIKNPKFTFKESFQSDMDFDGDGSPGGKISNFLVPEPIEGEVNAAKLTCFVGEGDENKPGDYIRVTGENGTGAKLWDGITCTNNSSGNPNNIWNSMSLGASASGVDIDTPGINPTSGQYITWASGILETGDTWAQINLPSPGDGITLVYIILSFRSEIKTSGTISYIYVGGG